MNEKIDYYLAFLSSLCGFDSPDQISIGGVLIIVIALVALVISIYKMVAYTLWPGEPSLNHIKRTVLSEEGVYEN